MVDSKHAISNRSACNNNKQKLGKHISGGMKKVAVGGVASKGNQKPMEGVLRWHSMSLNRNIYPNRDNNQSVQILPSTVHVSTKPAALQPSLACSSSTRSTSSQHPSDLLSYGKMCDELEVMQKIEYDWRNSRHSCYKPDRAKVLIYLSERIIRFRKKGVQEFAAQGKLEVKS